MHADEGLVLHFTGVPQSQVTVAMIRNTDGPGFAMDLVMRKLAAFAMGEPFPDAKPVALRLPDERHGLLFVFRTFERASYALILNVRDPVRPGDRFTQP